MKNEKTGGEQCSGLVMSCSHVSGEQVAMKGGGWQRREDDSLDEHVDLKTNILHRSAMSDMSGTSRS